MLCSFVGIDEIAGLVLRWPDDDLLLEISELVEIVADHILKLAYEQAWLCPLSIGTKRDLTGNGAERVRVHMVGEPALIQRLYGVHGFGKHLHAGIAVGHIIVA